MAHLVFIWAMAMLAYWLERNGLTKEKGWRLIQVSCVTFIAWNACAFAGHWLTEMAPSGIIVGTSEWNEKY